MLTIRASSFTDQGDRENNEDQAAILAGCRVLVVADGMGGQRAGELASRMAVEVVGEWESARLEQEEGEAVLAELRALLRRANGWLMEAVGRDPQLWGMGTTLTLGAIGGGRLYFAHLGDSRLYLWRGGKLELLTDDHTRAGEYVRQGLLSEAAAARSAQRHVLVRYLGTANQVEPQLGVRELRQGDRLLLCSDGLYNSLGTERLAGLMGEAGAPEDLARQLVVAAANEGERPLDNITALVAQIGAEETGGRSGPAA